jgi:hypothetical protein
MANSDEPVHQSDEPQIQKKAQWQLRPDILDALRQSSSSADLAELERFLEDPPDEDWPFSD